MRGHTFLEQNPTEQGGIYLYTFFISPNVALKYNISQELIPFLSKNVVKFRDLVPNFCECSFSQFLCWEW